MGRPRCQAARPAIRPPIRRACPARRLSASAPDFFFGPTSPSASSRVSPCTRDQHARMAPAIFRSLRGVCGMARPRPPADDNAGEQSLGLLGFGQFDGWAAIDPDRPDSLQTSSCRALGFQRHGQCKRATSRTTAREDCRGSPISLRHAFRQHLEPRRRDGRQ